MNKGCNSKNRKRIIAVILSLLLLVCVLPSFSLKTHAEGEDDEVTHSGDIGEEKNIHWELTRGGTLTLSGTGEMVDYRPKEVQYFSCAPWYKYLTVKKVIVEEGITRIGSYAFYKCYDLESITLPDSIVTIGNYTFEGCWKLNTIFIPKNVEEIGPWGTFQSCSGLEEIQVDVDSEYFTSVDGVLFSKSMKAIYCYPGMKAADVYRIPDTVNTIQMGAFSAISQLDALVIPEGVTGFGAYTIGQLKRLELPVSLVSVGQDAYIGGYAIEDLYYRGSEEEWEKMDGRWTFDYINIHFNSSIETPADDEPKTITYKGYSTTFRPKDLYQSSMGPANESFSKLGALLSEAAYHQNNEGGDVTQILSQMGIKQFRSSYFPINDDGEMIYCETVGYDTLKINGVDTNVVVVVFRGTDSEHEKMADHFTKANGSYLGYNIYDDAGVKSPTTF